MKSVIIKFRIFLFYISIIILLIAVVGKVLWDMASSHFPFILGSCEKGQHNIKCLLRDVFTCYFVEVGDVRG